MPELTREQFDTFRRLVYKKSGIALSEAKEALVQGRLGKRLRQHGFTDYAQYLALLEQDESGEEVVHFLDAIATNVTHFFREKEHFEFLAARLLEWRKAGQERFRLWSTACSSGEEPYSIAISCLEALGPARVDLRILATDLSTKVLAQAREGVYRLDRLREVPPEIFARYFERCGESRGEPTWRVADALRRLVTFCRLNLAAPPFPMKGPFDAVFCRNVMIYFDNPVRKALLDEISRLLRPGGYLFVGHAESLTGRLIDLAAVKPSIYRKP